MIKKYLPLLALSPLYAAQSGFDPSIAGSPTPPGRFEAAHGVGLYTSAEALLLQLTQDDYPIANLTNVPLDVGLGAPADGSYTSELFHYNAQWKWGFRVKAGYHLPHDGWDLEAVYTRFYTHNDKQVINPYGASYTLSSGAQEILLLGAPALADNSISFRWGVKFNQWDLLQSRQFFVSQYLRVQPLLGLRNLLLGQTFSTTVNITTDSITHNYLSQTSIHFWGMGVLAGVNTIWNFNRQFSLYGGLKVASMFGHFHPRFRGHLYSEGGTVTTINDKQKATKTCLDLALGFAWDKNFYDNKLHLGLNIGFEQYTYFNMNKSFYGYTQAVALNGLSGRDFVMQGFAFGLRADY